MKTFAFIRRQVSEQVIHVRAESARSARVLAEDLGAMASGDSMCLSSKLRRAPEYDNEGLDE